jgi:A/G-specific adenine glycosylase
MTGIGPAERAAPTFGLPFAEFSHRLLSWFFKNKRELPWREEHDPYRVWISEVMLQQTRSHTAAGYYERWLLRFPTIEALAVAEQEEVLKMWEGLGYYSRARNLHRSARIIVEDLQGQFPDTEEQIRKLPGIGEYTAAAVLSIAFAKPLGVVDGNVKRIVTRLLADGRPAKATVRTFIEASILHYHPGWINQAWMELGALICMPRPHCDRCPLSYLCLAYREDRIDEFPPQRQSKPLPVRLETLLLLLDGSLPPQPGRELNQILRKIKEERIALAELGKLLHRHNLSVMLVKREEKGLLGGLWELPNFPQRNSKLADRMRDLSIAILLNTNREVRHRYSHFEIRFHLIVAVSDMKMKLGSWVEQRWVRPADLGDFPRPKVHIEALRRFGLIEE